MTIRQRYNDAHQLWFSKEYPAAFKDGHYTPPVFPKIATSNGLTGFIINFLNWSGHRATRISVSGRLIETPQKQPSGVILTTKKWMHSTTRKGTADISATVRGKSVMIEIKVGNDRPRPAQIAEQQRERAAQGIYEFIGSPQEFFTLYDHSL